jgi:hypothetical protein
MKNILRKSLSIIFLLLGLISCIDENVEPESLLSEPEFLINPHNIWTYAFYDSLNGKKDTVSIRSLGETLYDKRTPAFIWQLKFKNYTDTHYVFISKQLDSLRVVPNFTSRERYFKLRMIFPLVIGKKWKGEWFNDTVRVLKQEKAFAGNTIYSNAYYLEEKWGALNDYGNMKVWYYPQVGILKLHRREWGFGFMNQTWELISLSKN